jgi:uncharacterized repeat protein (TIGR01451 family)
LTNNDDSDTNTVEESADVAVTKDDGVSVVVAGDGVTYTYTITVTNNGPSDADGVSVADTWPLGFTQGVLTPSQGTTDAIGGDFTWTIGTVEAGTSETLTISYTVPSQTVAGDYTNSVVVTSDTPDADLTNNNDSDTNTVEESADVAIAKDDGVSVVVAGDGVTYTYTITVTNNGPSDADNVLVSDTWPVGFTQGTIGTPSEGTIGGTAPNFTWTIATLESGDTETVTVSYTVPSSTSAGDYTNSVVVTSDTPDLDLTNNEDSDTNTVEESADVAVAKDDGVSVVVAGDGVTYTYTITVTNNGPSDADGVSVSDTWPLGFTQGVLTPSQGTTDAA